VLLYIKTQQAIYQYIHTWCTVRHLCCLRYYEYVYTSKTKDRATRIPLKTGDEPMFSGKVSSSCTTSGTRRATLVTNPVISHEWGKDQVMLTRIGKYLLSFVIQIFCIFWRNQGDRKTFRMMTWTKQIPCLQQPTIKEILCKQINSFINLNLQI
jgi:hypothetical protein